MILPSPVLPPKIPAEAKPTLGEDAFSTPVFVPSNLELTVLCGDFLRHSVLEELALRRSNNNNNIEKNDPTTPHHDCDERRYFFQTLASWALHQALAVVTADPLQQPTKRSSKNQQGEDEDDEIVIPTLEEMERDLTLQSGPPSSHHSSTNNNSNNNTTNNSNSHAHDGGEAKETKESEDLLVEQTNTTEREEADPEWWWANDAEEDAPWAAFRLLEQGGWTTTTSSSSNNSSSNNNNANSRCLRLGDVVTAGCWALRAQSRRAAEQDFVTQSPLFAHYLTAVQAKAFFQSCETTAPPNPLEPTKNTTTCTNSNSSSATMAPLQQQQQQQPSEQPPPQVLYDANGAVYRERFAKVVAKFRQKISQQNHPPSTDSTPTITDTAWLTVAAFRQQERQDKRNNNNKLTAGTTEGATASTTTVVSGLPIPLEYQSRRSAFATEFLLQQQENATTRTLEPSHSTLSIATTSNIKSNNNTLSSSHRQDESHHHPADLQAAESLKHKGNAHMQRQEYQQALDSYTAALQRSPAGPHSHVYFANRAAALVSLQQWPEAAQDAERSLSLQPDYAKAHARLGLAHFLQGHYRQAVYSYTAALRYEPDNVSSQHYLHKAAQRLAAEEQQQPSVSSADAGDMATAAVKQSASQSSWSSTNRAAELKSSAPSIASLSTEERQAEQYKSKGNALMAQRDYPAALDAYTHAIQVCPASPACSHVYYANRAAAWCYLEGYAQARDDAMESKTLQPSYGKAHARLGLALFCLREYAGAVQAYQEALVHDPTNSAAQSYLAKAQAKVAKAAAAAQN